MSQTPITDKQRRQIRKIVNGDENIPVEINTAPMTPEQMNVGTEEPQEFHTHPHEQTGGNMETDENQIDADKVIDRLSLKVAELTKQVAILEVYMETKLGQE